jgi:hypothetical protein
MEMQDKEFDDLFHSKLDGFEIEPSAHVWHGIAGELAAGKRRKSLLPFLSVAASIVVLVAAGVLFIPQKASLTVKHNVKPKPGQTLVHPVTSGLAVTKSNPVVLPAKNAGKLIAATISKTNAQPVAKTNGLVITTVNKQAAKSVDTAVAGNKQTLAAITQKPEAIKAIVPDSNTQIAIKQPMQISPAFTAKPEIAAVHLPTAEKQDVQPVKSSRKVHSIGHFINSVVAKIDKRQDKFIEFTDIDDEGSVLTGVNLGFVKIKKEK